MIIQIKKTALSVVFIVLLHTQESAAQGSGMPTFDAANYMQAVQELQRMQELISKAEEEISMLGSQLEALTGPRGMGELLNDLTQQNIRRYSPQNWQDTLDILNAGGNPGSLSDVKNIYEQRQNTFGHLSGSDVSSSPAYSSNIESYEYARGATLGSMALSETSFNRNDARITNYEHLLGEIDSAADAKAAADLANRIAVENGLVVSRSKCNTYCIA